MGAQLGAPKSPRTPQQYRIDGFKTVLNLSPIMPRDASVSDTEYKIFQSRRIANCKTFDCRLTPDFFVHHFMDL